MSLFMSNWLIDTYLAENERLRSFSGHENEFRRCVGPQKVKLHILTQRLAGAFLTPSFLLHASFAFLSILPVKDCLQT